MDPHLFEMMHGTPKKAISSPLEAAIQNEVDKVMSEDVLPNHAETPQEKRAKIEQKVRASTDFEEYGNLMSSAFQILDRENNEILSQNLDSIRTNLKSLNFNEITEEKMKAALALSQETQEIILKVGIAKFSEGLIEECLPIFYFLAHLVDDDPDYWYRLGLAAEKLGNYNLALQAFARTSNLAPDFIGGHLFASECNILNGRYEVAISELEEAKRCFKTLETHDAEDWRAEILEIEQRLAAA